MSRYQLVFYPDRCSACGACSVACMDQNDTDPAATGLPLRHVFEWEYRNGEREECVYASASCMHCEDAPCIPACPAGCIRRDLETGMVICDNSGCIGCHSCAMACPYGAPRFGEDGRMLKCDGCAIRLQHGRKPACVLACAFDALQCVDREEYNRLTQDKAQRAMLRAVGELGRREGAAGAVLARD